MNEKARIEGKLWPARNWSADAGPGSVHDDATAAKLGFRGGTVAGNIHMDQYAAVLVDVFGPTWFERGALSLYFLNATVDGEAVRVTSEARSARQDQIAVAMFREDGLQVSAGTASLYDHSISALKSRDLKAMDPASLRILKPLRVGQSLGNYEVTLDTVRFRERLQARLISDPLSWYEGSSPWGGPIASPSLLVELLWGPPMRGLTDVIGTTGGVGLFGAIEVAHHNGPVYQDRSYSVSARVVAVSESPKTESMWFDSSAHDDAGRLIVTQRMMLRFMKDSSPLYR
jgi:hypothetical protein